MKRDKIVDGGAMLDVEGTDVTYLLGSVRVIDMQKDPQKAALVRYRLALRHNEERPCLSSAVEVVDAFQGLRSILGLDQA